MNFKNKNILYTGISLVVFILLAIGYASPVLTGKQLLQHDIVQYKGGAKELLDYRAQYGKETYWSDAMFGGMPTYQTGAQFRGDFIKKIDETLNFLPKPANFLFLLFAGFFMLGQVVTRNWKYALLGATLFGLSTYFYIIIAAGHNGKVATLVYFAPLLAGILLVYIRKQYILGFITTALFMGLQIAANHPQMTYYLFLALGFLFISELIRAATGKTAWKHFLTSSGILAFAFILGIGMNSQRLMANAEYVKETVRGKQILKSDRNAADSDGMKKEEILNWSYGKLETLNLFIPRLMGGASDEKGSDEMIGKLQQLVQENVSSQQEYDQISKGLGGSLTYWGEQPGTSGPAYQGAVVIFLAILGFFWGWKKYRYWILGASVLSILLAWGSHFMPISDFFISYVPMYDKFRAPSSILVVVELLFPLIAIIGIFRAYQDDTLDEKYRNKILVYVTGSITAFLLLLLLFGKDFLGFSTDQERTYLPSYLLNFLVEERFSMFRIDALKALAYVLLTAGALYLVFLKKLSQNIALILIGLVSVFDLWTVNKRYLNQDNFVDKAFAESPYISENSDYLADKAGENDLLKDLISRTNMNKTLETIAQKDTAHYRVFNTILGTFGETNTSYYKASVGGYHAVKLRRYDDLINHYFSPGDSVATPKILDMLNAKYWMVGDQQNPKIIPNTTANGNAWFVSNIKWVNNANEEIEEIGKINNKKTAVINTEDKSYFQGKSLKADSTAYVDLVEYRADELKFKTQSKTPQLAVFSEIYYPKGWKVFLDETEVPYIKANYLLRALYVPAGKHKVRMVFEPAVIEKGKIISWTAFSIFILLSIAGIYVITRKQKVAILPETK